jgi:hypothetical protein
MKDKAALELYQWKNELLYGPPPADEGGGGGVYGGGAGGVYLYPAAAERTDAAQGREGGGEGVMGQIQHSVLDLSERKGGFVTGFKAISAV